MLDKDRKYRVLFVDDERRILTALRSIFRREYEVFTANGGAEALEILQKNRVDVVVSDQRMPNMLGNELLAKVHQLYPQTMRVLLTGFMDKAAIIDTINQGQIYRFINKPWKNEDIREIIAEAALASEFEMEALETAEQETAVQNSALEPNSVNAKQSALSGDALSSTVKPVNPTKLTNKLSKTNSQKVVHNKPAVLLMDDGKEIAHQLKNFCRKQKANFHQVTDIQSSVTQLKTQKEIGVFIITLPIDSAETLQTISLLKQHRPEVITTVLATQTDAETIVSLINSGQVFRYLSKPCDPLLLEMTIEESFKQNRLLKRKASLQKRVKVDNRKLTFSERIKQLFTAFGQESSPTS